MMLQNYIETDFPFLKGGDTIAQAIDILESANSKGLPVIKDNKVLGVVNLDLLYSITNEELRIEKLVDTEHKAITIEVNSHLFHAVGLMNVHKLHIIPVVDEQENYVGILTLDKMLPFLGSNPNQFSEYGILVLEMGTRNYSLSEISKIVEMHNAHIIQSLITQDENSELLDVHLKINKADLKDIILSLERYEYFVKSVFHQSEYDIDFKEKINAFLDYLKI